MSEPPGWDRLPTDPPLERFVEEARWEKFLAGLPPNVIEWLAEGGLEPKPLTEVNAMADDPKFGAGALQAFLRQGLKELGTANIPLPDSVQVDEPGTIGNLTPLEVYQTKHPEMDSPQVQDPEPEMH